ncbi:MAG TPA: helix-turn-helix domain-containing protein [Caulobacteraceae bacterium]|jgi:DNA-binding HxlR family transcriptional regulator
MVAVRYGQYCPVAMTAEVLCTRWTMLLIRELLEGPARFNDLRRGVPRMSPALLSQRLRELEDAGIVVRTPQRKGGELYEYVLTEAGWALGPVIQAFGAWGQAWIEEKATLDNASVDNLMWQMQQRIRPDLAPHRPSVVSIQYRDQAASKARWWIVFEREARAEICHDDPGADIDLYVATDLPTMISIWLGLATVRDREAAGALLFTGNRSLADSMSAWLGLSPVAGIPKRGGVRAAISH